MKYKLNVKQDVETINGDFSRNYFLTLPYGFRFYDDLVHVRGYDTMRELRLSARTEIISCNCQECVKALTAA
jgi:hypothetical protein